MKNSKFIWVGIIIIIILIFLLIQKSPMKESIIGTIAECETGNSNGYCISPYGEKGYSDLTKMFCIDENVLCPLETPYVFHFNTEYKCRCIDDPSEQITNVEQTNPPIKKR